MNKRVKLSTFHIISHIFDEFTITNTTKNIYFEILNFLRKYFFE